MQGKSYKAWVLSGPGEELRYEDFPVPDPDPLGVLVRIERAPVLSYMRRVLDGSLGYALPPTPFVPGTDAVGWVEAVGSQVLHVEPDDHVYLSSHYAADLPIEDPPQILIGLTAIGTSRFDGVSAGARRLQRVWRNGTFAELAHWPASCVTRLPDSGRTDQSSWVAIAKLVVPYGGLLRAGARPGQVVLVNGATGYFGSAAVMIALAMGAARVVAIGRDRATLSALVATLGARVVPAIVTGTNVQADCTAICAAADDRGDIAIDLLGRASATTTTLATLRSLRRGGRLVLMGSATAPLEIGFGEMLSNDWEVVGQFMYPTTAVNEVAALIVSGLLDLSPIRIHAFPLHRLPDAIIAATTMRGLDLTMIESGELASTPPAGVSRFGGSQ